MKYLVILGLLISMSSSAEELTTPDYKLTYDEGWIL